MVTCMDAAVVTNALISLMGDKTGVSGCHIDVGGSVPRRIGIPPFRTELG